MDEHIRISHDGPITWITLDRPSAMNAITPDMHRQLDRIFDEFSADPNQHIAVVTGAGEKAFCAGSDLKSGLGVEYPKSGYAGIGNRFDLNKPVIAMVNGAALGGGFELALACDLIIASSTATFGLPEPLIGAVALGGGLHRLPRQIGLKPAMDMILTSQSVSAERGRDLGFVNEVVPLENLKETTQAYCELILKGAPGAITASKAIINRSLNEPDLETAIAHQDDYPEFQNWKSSEDAMEGINAFIEKREPIWKGC